MGPFIDKGTIKRKSVWERTIYFITDILSLIYYRTVQ